jgi:hypothetical protein
VGARRCCGSSSLLFSLRVRSSGGGVGVVHRFRRRFLSRVFGLASERAAARERARLGSGGFFASKPPLEPQDPRTSQDASRELQRPLALPLAFPWLERGRARRRARAGCVRRRLASLLNLRSQVRRTRAFSSGVPRALAAARCGSPREVVGVFS